MLIVTLDTKNIKIMGRINMSRARKKGNSFSIIFIVILIIVVVLISKNNSKKDLNNNTQNQVIEIISNTLPDEETPEEIIYIDLNNEEKVKCCAMLGTFDDGKALTTEQYLKVVYNAINYGYVSSSNDKYTEQEIEDIVYTIFNVELNENKSIDGLKYENGYYTIERKLGQRQELNIIESGTAVGSVYIMYELEGSNYIARLTTNGVTGKNYISSIIEG